MLQISKEGERFKVLMVSEATVRGFYTNDPDRVIKATGLYLSGRLDRTEEDAKTDIPAKAKTNS